MVEKEDEVVVVGAVVAVVCCCEDASGFDDDVILVMRVISNARPLLCYRGFRGQRVNRVELQTPSQSAAVKRQVSCGACSDGWCVRLVVSAALLSTVLREVTAPRLMMQLGGVAEQCISTYIAVN